MKKFWCLVLIAILLVGCGTIPDAPIGQVTPAPETPETILPSSAATAPLSQGSQTPDVVELTVTAGAAPEPTPEPTRSPEERLYA